jgi:hypothetical protein
MDSIALFGEGQGINQIVDENQEIWWNIKAVGDANGKGKNFANQITKSKEYSAYLEAMRRTLERDTLESIYKVVDSTKETELFKRGSYLNISKKEGRLLLLYIAQKISPDFYIWCNNHVESVMNKGYSISDHMSPAQQVTLQQELNKYMKLNEQNLITIDDLETRLQARSFPHYERTICNALERYWKAFYTVERNVRVNNYGTHNYIDFILSDKIIVEVKRVDNWREALGQIGEYEILLKNQRGKTRRYAKWIYLFGPEISAEQEDHIREIVSTAKNTFVWFHTDINQLPDRR